MATNNLKVDEIRAQLAKRGLSTAGIKLVLVRRLEDALRDESEKSADSEVILEVVAKGREIQTLRMPIQKCLGKLRPLMSAKYECEALREEASIRGVSAAGTKAQLLERLCADDDSVSSDNDEVSSTEEEKEEKIVTATKKGSAVLDKWLPDHIKAQYHVLQVDDEIYDAMLNQTNVGENNNKFFVIQVLGYNSILIL
ncbi:UNVERIFIED_CONTAM: Poly [ADP-ribose] polymerase 2 [Sesamum radiatum]|uniref:NAD(+) ADP-ribosyltransferase n=1 Tax=Sesamum radiatum TaxID=300843 RepID=A0AAW2UUZ4_SESRA